MNDSKQRIAELEALNRLYVLNIERLAEMMKSCASFITSAIRLNGVWEQQSALLLHNQEMVNGILERLKADVAGDEWKSR